jgi:hypothetical protein
MCARKRLNVQFALALPLCVLMFGICSDAPAQNVWQKMKQNVLQQQCQQGLQKACQVLAQQNQKQPQQAPAPGQQPAQPGVQPSVRNSQQANRVRDDGGPVHPPNGTKIEETVLAPVSTGAKFFISPHGVHLATYENSGSRVVIYYDGVPGPKFDEILGGTNNSSVEAGLVFSPDGKRYAYCGRAGTEMVVMVDGKEYLRTSESNMGRFDGSSCKLGFTSNSKHVFLYSEAIKSTARGDRRTRFIFDGKDVPGSTTKPTGGSEDLRNIFFSPDGDHFALVVTDPADETRWGLVVDGKMAPYRGSPVAWSADSQHLYTTLGHPGPTAYVEAMLDGKPFLRADQFQLHVAPAGNMWVAVVDAGIRNPSPTQFLVVSGKKVPGSEIVHERGAFIDEIAFSPDGKHYAARYTTTQNHQYLILDGKRAEEYQRIDHIQFTSDSSKVTYTAFMNAKPYAIIGDQESESCFPEPAVIDSRGGLVIAPVGGRAGGICSLNGGEAPTIYLDGKTLHLPEGVRGANDLRFSPDGEHYAYSAGFQGGGMRLVLDGVVQMNSNVATANHYVFSLDSKHIAVASAPPNPTGEPASGIFLDGKYSPIMPNPGVHILEFTADSKHIAWAQGVPSCTCMRIYIDGKAVAQPDFAVIPSSREPWWDMLPDGSLAVLVQDQNNLKRITITP